MEFHRSPTGILRVTALNLYIKIGTYMLVSCKLSFAVHEYGLYLHLFSSVISLGAWSFLYNVLILWGDGELILFLRFFCAIANEIKKKSYCSDNEGILCHLNLFSASCISRDSSKKYLNWFGKQKRPYIMLLPGIS